MHCTIYLSIRIFQSRESIQFSWLLNLFYFSVPKKNVSLIDLSIKQGSFEIRYLYSTYNISLWIIEIKRACFKYRYKCPFIGVAFVFIKWINNVYCVRIIFRGWVRVRYTYPILKSCLSFEMNPIIIIVYAANTNTTYMVPIINDTSILCVYKKRGNNVIFSHARSFCNNFAFERCRRTIELKATAHALRCALKFVV